MDLYSHLLTFFEIFVFILKSHAAILVLRGVLHHFICYLIPCCIAFGALYYFRLEKPTDSRVRRILGNKWGAYGSSDDGSNNDVVKVIGHRACGLDAPENSISALNRMHQKGIQMVEFDVTLTSDHVPIVFHDSNLYRMTDVNKNIADMSLDEIKEIDISVRHPFGKNYPNEMIPTLYDFVSSCISKNIRMVIDLKDGSKRMIQIINGLFEDFPELYELAIVSSFNPVLIYQIRANDPKIICSLCWRPYYHSHEEFNGLQGPSKPRSKNLFVTLYQRILNIMHYWFLWNVGYYLIGVSAVLLAKDAVTREHIRYWNKRGIRLIAWCVNLPSEKQYFENNLQITYMTDTIINS